MDINCVINFDNIDGDIFHSGQSIKGSIELTLSESTTCRHLLLTIEGHTECEWSKLKASVASKFRWLKCTNRAEHLKEIIHLFGCNSGSSSDDSGPIELASGDHKFTFSCTLPSHLPSSFEGAFGSTRYQATAALDMFDAVHVTSRKFSILRTEDLNGHLSALRMPVATELLSKAGSFWCCNVRPALDVSIRLSRNGFVPNEDIQVTVYANEVNVAIMNVRIELIQVVVYTSAQPLGTAKREENKLVTVNGPFVGKRPSQMTSFTRVLSVPPCQPSNGLACHIIRIAYQIRVTFDIGGTKKAPTVALPITIGTVPLKS